VAVPHSLNDFTNAFKAYRREALDGCRPFLPSLQPDRGAAAENHRPWLLLDHYADHLAEQALGISKLKIKEMGSRYLFIALYCWLEKYFSRGDYVKKEDSTSA